MSIQGLLQCNLITRNFSFVRIIVIVKIASGIRIFLSFHNRVFGRLEKQFSISVF